MTVGTEAAGKQSGISTGHSMRPAPCVVAMRNDHATSAVNPACIPDAHAMPMPVTPVIQRPADQEETGTDAECAQIDDETGPKNAARHNSDRESVSECNRKG